MISDARDRFNRALLAAWWARIETLGWGRGKTKQDGLLQMWRIDVADRWLRIVQRYRRRAT